MERVTKTQFITLIICFYMATSMRSVLISKVAGTDSWIAAITGAVVCLALILVMSVLNKKFPGKNLFEINEAVFGKVIGIVVSCVYLFFFIIVAALNILEAGSFISDFIMPGTSIVYVMVVFTLCCCYAVRKGIEPVAKVSTVFAACAFAVLLLNSILSLSDANFDFLFPMLTRPFLSYVQATHAAAAVPYGEIVIFAMLFPALGNEKAKKPLLLSLFAGTIIMLLILVREAVILGPVLEYVTMPSYEVLRMIDIADIITRIESIYAFVLVSLTFFKVSAALYACCAGIAQVTRFTDYRRLALLMGMFAVIFAYNGYVSQSDSLHWGADVLPFIYTLFEYALPLITVITALVKFKMRKNNIKEAEA